MPYNLSFFLIYFLKHLPQWATNFSGWYEDGFVRRAGEGRELERRTFQLHPVSSEEGVPLARRRPVLHPIFLKSQNVTEKRVLSSQKRCETDLYPGGSNFFFAENWVFRPARKTGKTLTHSTKRFCTTSDSPRKSQRLV